MTRGRRGGRANKFTLTWRNPPQSFAPIVAAEYELCPTTADDASAAAKAEAQRQCVRGTRTGDRDRPRSRTSACPRKTRGTPELWLRDGAGNQQPASAVTVDGLDYDITPPATSRSCRRTRRIRRACACARPTPARASGPARSRSAATARTSGARCATEVTDYGLTAMLDDETLAEGHRTSCARAPPTRPASSSPATAGRTATPPCSSSRSGSPAASSPAAPATAPADAPAAGHRTRRCCHRRLATKPQRARRPRDAPVRPPDRQPPGRAGHAGARCGASSTAARDWKRIGTATTSKTGRFSYKARRGPARTIRFRYPGTSMIRGRNADVRLRVRASTSIAVNRRTVINGEYVTIHGHLRGGWIPAGGVLVELQVRARGAVAHLRPTARRRHHGPLDATATASRPSAAARSFQFRARIRRQRGFPFTTGHSRQIRVRVRGL